MAIWEKLFSKITFKDYPDTSTPLNAINLNKMTDAIDRIDDRVVELNSKLSKTITCNYSCLCDNTSTYEVDLSEYADAKAFIFAGYHNAINSGGYQIARANINGNSFHPIYNDGNLVYLLQFNIVGNKLIVSSRYSADAKLSTYLTSITVIY